MQQQLAAQLAEHVHNLNAQANAWQANLQEQAAAQVHAAVAQAQGAAAPMPPPPHPPPQPEPAHGFDGMPRGYRPSSDILPQFHGNMGEEVDTCLFLVEEILGMYPIPNEDLRLRYVSMALRDTAATWYASMRRAEADERITDWATFVGFMAAAELRFVI